MRHECAVVLTATIRPRFQAWKSKRIDPVLRARDYVAGIRFWDSLHDDRIVAIVLCDNSGEDLRDLREAVGETTRPIEFLCYSEPEPPPNVHYGYGELGILDHAFKNSSLIKRASHFLKGTGRLTFPAISRLLDSLPDGVDCLVDHRRPYRAESDAATRAQTQLMLFSTKFYANELYRCRTDMVGVCSHIEEFLPRRLAKACSRWHLLHRFPVECPPSGIGGNGNRYDAAGNRLKSLVRGFTRRWVPTWWL